MRIIRRFLFGQIVSASAMVCAAFLLLFGFFDLVDELGSLKTGYGLAQALAYVLALMPDHLYDLMPIGVLIGCVLVLSRLALNSEFTIMRTSGLGPGLMLATLLGLGLLFSVLTMTLGDYLAPASNRLADRIKGEQRASGAWLRDRQDSSQFVVRVSALRGADGLIQDVTILQFNQHGHLQTRIDAKAGQIQPAAWDLQQVRISHYPEISPAAFTGGANPSLETENIRYASLPQYHWRSNLSAEMVKTAMVSPSSLATFDLYRYTQHLKANQQNPTKYEIALWRKVLYPLSCLVMVMLALPFAYLHHRNGTAAGYVFIGVMMGIGFYLFNNVANHIGDLRGWTPWLAAALPSMVFGSVALGTFSWLVLRR
jgi:lipopolysaccharide export system permease protein